ncbi:hypothetical protein [Halomonas elongata]|uniref:hypothetical protein n=1 Tax=Halomonas elongata TaxID=2746 RepID=UPI00186B8B21|nr:hypothetical protein [Halomonas elongata]MBW5801169.1 hypothetical protein [Halomonas elongata]
MIMISSTAGQRLAKAKAALDQFRQRHPQAVPVVEQHKLLREYDEASAELADELIKDNHHLVEGD